MMNQYQQFKLIQTLIEAELLLQKLRMKLIEAEQIVPFGHPLKEEIHRRYRLLYADTVGTFSGGDGLFFNLQAITLSVTNPVA